MSNKIGTRIDRLEKGHGSDRLAVITQRTGESDDEARARHMADNPADRHAATTILVRWFDEPGPTAA